MILSNRLKELADRSYAQNIYTFTDFLGMAEMNEFWQMERELNYAGFTIFGGYEHAERCMVRFGNPDSLGYEAPFPIVCIHITPLLAKFADDLSHRDFLGALMNLGIERSTMGDIKTSRKEAFLFCTETIAPFICDNLDKVKHTNVKCTLVSDPEELLRLLPAEELTPLTIQVQSPRVDGVLAKVCRLSRNEVLELFRTQKVFVDGKLCENNAMNLKGGEIVNARGYGKFQMPADYHETKKGKLSITVSLWK